MLTTAGGAGAGYRPSMSEPSGMPPRLDLQPVDESFERALVVVAHPDDIEYGTAAAVDKWTKAGKSVTYLLATRGEAGIDTIAPEEAGPLRAQEERLMRRLAASQTPPPAPAGKSEAAAEEPEEES